MSGLCYSTKRLTMSGGTRTALWIPASAGMTEGGAVVRQAHHERPVLQHQEAHHERGHPHRPLDSSLRWNDGRGQDGSTGSP